MKKKTNPNKIPRSLCPEAVQSQISEAIRQQLFVAWASFLAATASLKSSTHDSILELWKVINNYPNRMMHKSQAQLILNQMEEITGFPSTITTVDISSIQSQQDLKLALSAIRKNSFLISLSMIAEPILALHLYDEETLYRLWRRTLSYGEDIHNGRIKLKDIQKILVDEYQIHLCFTLTGVSLKIQNTA